MMADITNTMNASIPINAVSGQIISPESSESVLLSTGVREAMDLIFPKSTSQLLQRGHSFEEDKFLGIKASKENLHPGTTAVPTSHANAPPCCVSSAWINTTTTTSISVTASSEMTSAYGNGSHPHSLSSFVFTYTPPVYSPASRSQEEAKEPNAESLTAELSGKNMVKADVSKLDFVASTNEAVGDEFIRKESKRDNTAGLSNKFDCRGDSDSGDVMRPFASNVKEKKRKKKKKKMLKSAGLICETDGKKSDRKVIGLSKSGMNSDTQSLDCDGSSVTSVKDIDHGGSSVTSIKDIDHGGSSVTSIKDIDHGGSSVTSIKDIISNKEILQHNSRNECVAYNNFNNINSSRLNCKDSVPQSQVFTNGPLTNFHTFLGMASEKFSNISFLPVTENVQNGKRKSRQSLPEVKRHHFHIVKHKNKIRNTFLPCFVVINKIYNFSSYNHVKHLPVADTVLPLFVRLKHLSDLCDKGSVACKKKKVVYEMVYRNIFEETVLPQVPEDNSDNLGGKRSLRKRDKHISYVEPSEDDILDEYSRKRARTKHKDLTDRSEDESLGESKRKKKKGPSDSNTISENSIAPVIITPSRNMIVEDKAIENTTNVIETSKTEVKDQKKVTAVERSKLTNSTPKEIIVYPPTSSSIKNLYRFKVDGKDMPASKVGKPQQKTYSKEKDKNGAPGQPSSNISILQPTTLPGSFMRHPNAVMLFPSLAPGFSTSTTAKSLAPGAPAIVPVSTSGDAQKPPQYCMVKMDGANVLLQIVPSSGTGVPAPVIMPKGKTLISAPVPLAPKPSKRHLLQSTLSVTNPTQALPTSLSVVTVSQAKMTSQVSVSPAPLQSLFGIPVLSTSSQNISLPVLSIASSGAACQLASATSTTITSGTCLSQNSTAGVPRYVTVMTSLNSRITSAVAPVMSSSLSNQTLPAIVTSMAAPNTTTVVRSVRMPGPSLRAIAPNQPASLRSVRIFVPGCSTLGTPGHFATIGSIANSSPLTHLTASSALLPQRKLSSDPELSPEQRLARRRKLEKKYPLPPGVVIKTEPLDVATKPSCIVSVANAQRSLLSQNLHLLSTRPGTSFQSIRIISPSLASALSGKNVRGNSGIIYRAASIGGRQTVLLPASFRQISTKTTAAVTPTSLTASSSFAYSSPACLDSAVTTGVDTTTTTAVINTTCTSDISLTQTVSLSSSKTPPEEISSPSLSSAVPQLAISENTLTSMPTTTSENSAELLTEGISFLQTSVITSRESSVTTNTPATSIASLLNTSCVSHSSALAVLANSTIGPEISSDKPPFDAVTLENIRVGIEELRKMIQIQEARGLKGERLEKLKELLHKKVEHYTGLQDLTSVNTAAFVTSEINCESTAAFVTSEINCESTAAFVTSEINCESTAAINCGGYNQDDVSVDGHHGSEIDPFVID